MDPIKHAKFAVLLSVLAVILPLEIVRAIVIAPFGKTGLAVKSWSHLTNLQVRVIRHSLTWAVRLGTWNAFDWHVAKLVHDKKDRIQLDRWAGFENKGLLAGTDLKDDIKANDMNGKFDALWFRPRPTDAETNRDKVILYFHGGGYTVQFYDDPMYYPMTAQFAKIAQRNLLSIDYRSSKSEPFPYALQDAVSAYRYLITVKDYKPQNITIAGDSAGANLALATLQYLMNRGGPEKGLDLPGRVFLISPWTDLTVRSSLNAEVHTKALTDYIPASMGLVGASQLTGTLPSEFDRRVHPYISPLFADFSPLKSTNIKIHITYGSVEFMSDELAQFVSKLKTEVGEEKVDVFIAPDMVHDHQLVFPALQITKDTYVVQGKWFEEKVVSKI